MAGFDHDSRKTAFFGQLNACIVANQGVTSIGNRLPDGVSKQGFGIDRVGRELHVRKCIPDAFNTVDHVKGSDHRNVRQPRRHAARFQDGSNDIIAADLQLCADVAALLHGQGREAAGDHDIGVQILKRIIIEILYNFVFKLITVRTFLENLLNERDNLGIGSIKNHVDHRKPPFVHENYCMMMIIEEFARKRK